MYESLGEACFIKQSIIERREREEEEGRGETETLCQGFLLIFTGLSSIGPGDLALPPLCLDQYFPRILNQHTLILHRGRKRGGKI